VTTRHAALCLFAALHLFVVACGALRVAWLEAPAGIAGKALKAYAGLSGADATYGFFAPAVPPRRRVRLELVDADGKQDVALLHDGASPEARSSLKSLLALFAKTPAARHDIAAYWAARMFDEHPGAMRVTAAVEEMVTPSMVSYLDGARPSWSRIYTETFTRLVPRR